MREGIDQVLRCIYSAYCHKYIFLLVTFSVMTAVGVYSFTLPKQYKADTTVFIEKNVIDDLVEGIAITSNFDERIRVLKYAILSRDLITKTLEDVESDIFTKSMGKQQAYISGLIDRTIVETQRNMDLFTVSLIDSNPEFAQRFINTLVGTYVEENLSAKRDETYGANRFLEEQLDVFKDKLEKAEDRIIGFRKKQGIYFSVNEAGTIAKIRELLAEIENISLSLDTLAAKKIQLTSQLAKTQPTVATVSESAENNRLQVMQSRLDSLLLRYTDNYPEVVRLRAEIAGLEQRLSAPDAVKAKRETTTMTSFNPLHQELQGQLFEVDAELSSLGARKTKLQQTVAKREQELKEVPTAKKELGILIQERDSYRSIYNDLLSRMGKSEVSKQMEIGNKAATFRVVDPAVLPETPVSPDMLKMFLLALISGLGCGFGVVLLLDNMDTRVRNVDFAKALGVEVLAVVPNLSTADSVKRRKTGDLVLAAFSGVYLLCFVGVFAYELFLRK